MPDYDTFFGSRGKAASFWDDVDRAVDVWTMIQDHPTSVTLKRGVTVLSAQTVLMTQTQSSQAAGQAGEAAVAGRDRVTLIGVRNHTIVPDFNVQRGDTFKAGGLVWKVVLVVANVPGMIEAQCEGQQ